MNVQGFTFLRAIFLKKKQHRSYLFFITFKEFHTDFFADYLGSNIIFLC